MTSTSIWQLSTTASSNTAIAGINIAENCAAANINDAIRELCAEVVGALKSVQATGTADALLASITPAPTALVDGMVVFVRAAAANATTAPTFVLNSIGSALSITQFGGQAVAIGAIAGANHELILRYVAADPASPHWELLNPAVAVPVASVADATNGGVVVTNTGGAVTIALKPSDLATKSAPTTSDLVVIGDAAASSAPKTATLAAIKSAIALNDLVVLEQQASSGSASGAFSPSAGSYAQVGFNTNVLDTGSNVVGFNGTGGTGSNQVMLAAGTYDVHWYVGLSRVQGHRGRLRNTTGGTTLVLGPSQYENTTSTQNVSLNTGFGRFTVAASQVLELDVFCTAAGAGVEAVGSGDVEIFNQIIFRRVA